MLEQFEVGKWYLVEQMWRGIRSPFLVYVTNISGNSIITSKSYWWDNKEKRVRENHKTGSMWTSGEILLSVTKVSPSEGMDLFRTKCALLML